MKITTFLMFQGEADAALSFYVSVLPDSSIEHMQRYGPDEEGKEGSVKQAVASLAGTRVMAVDSPAAHDFTFTPATSLFVDVDSLPQLQSLAAALGTGGKVLMPVGDYGFSQSFAWVQDRWGVSWQINLPF